jgi:hypothetical protein
VRNGQTHGKIELLHILHSLSGICKTRNQFVVCRERQTLLSAQLIVSEGIGNADGCTEWILCLVVLPMFAEGPGDIRQTIYKATWSAIFRVSTRYRS